MSGPEPGSAGEAAALLGVAEFELKRTIGWTQVVQNYVHAVDRYVERASHENDRLASEVDRLTHEVAMLSADAERFARERNTAQAEIEQLRAQLVQVGDTHITVDEAAKGWLALGALMANIDAAMTEARGGTSCTG